MFGDIVRRLLIVEWINPAGFSRAGRYLTPIPSTIPSANTQIICLVICLAMSENEIYKLGTAHITNDTNSAAKNTAPFYHLKNVMFEMRREYSSREDKAKHWEYLREMVFNLILKCVLAMG